MASDKEAAGAANGSSERGKRSTYIEVSSSIESEIRSGVYPPGSRLPPQRQLAAELGINVSTVSRAYEELQLRGLVIGSKRRGSLVTGGAMPSVEPVRLASTPAIDLTVNRPATGQFLDCLARTLGELPSDRRFAQMQEYQPPQGPAWARAAGARWMASSGFDPSPEHVVVTSGAQHGLYAVLNSLIGTEGVILADRLTYYGLKALAPVFQFEIVGIPNDRDGLLTDEVEAACRRMPVKAIFTVPNLQNPTVTTMSLARRMALVDTARRHGVAIIEDDVYGPLVSHRLPTIASLCPEWTFHIAGTSKILAPGLRLGYLLCPAHSAALCAEAVRTTAWMPAPMSMLIASLWIENGTAQRIMEAQLAEIRARQDLALELLPRALLQADPSCMFVWLKLPPPWRADDFAANAKARGVVVMPSSAFAVDRSEIEHGVRINLACAASRDELVSALRLLSGTLKDRPRALFGTI